MATRQSTGSKAAPKRKPSRKPRRKPAPKTTLLDIRDELHRLAATVLVCVDSAATHEADELATTLDDVHLRLRSVIAQLHTVSS